MDLKVDNQGQVDTFVIAATARVPALNAEDFRAQAEGDGIGVVLLDWSDVTPLPPLAVAVTIAGSNTVKFLRSQLTSSQDAGFADAANDAINHLASLPEWRSFADNLQSKLKSTSTGLGLAKAANRNWLEEIFSNRVLARQYLGQPLAPKDPSGLASVDRATLVDQLRPAFTGPLSSSIYVVLGTEGAGKSWLVADTWTKSQPASLLIFVTADELQPSDIADLQDFVIRKIIQQTNDEETDVSRRRWQRRFANWRANPNPPNIRITLCVDGLNQVWDFPWPRFIDAASLFMNRLGGQLIVTTRSTHFPTVRRTVVPAIERVTVPEWTPQELTQILQTRRVMSDVLSEDVFTTLRNPRILSIALELLDASDIQRIEDLSVGRLLFEHLRRSSSSGTTAITAAAFAKTLRELAEEFVNRSKSNDQDDRKLFDARLHTRLSAVSSSRFFKPVGEDPDRYEIVDEGLQLGLGLWLVDALEKERRNDRNPASQLVS